MLTERELPYNPASFAVADAMMVAQIKMAEEKLPNFPQLTANAYTADQRENIREAILVNATRNECCYATSLVITFLHNKYSDLFSGIILLQAVDAAGTLFDGRGEHHNFLLKDKTGVWYSGSPANHTTSDPNSRLTSLHVEDDLDELLYAIKKRDGGLWPTEEKITEALTNPTLAFPSLEYDNAPLHVTRITNNGNGNETAERFMLLCPSTITL